MNPLLSPSRGNKRSVLCSYSSAWVRSPVTYSNPFVLHMASARTECRVALNIICDELLPSYKLQLQLSLCCTCPCPLTRRLFLYFLTLAICSKVPPTLQPRQPNPTAFQQLSRQQFLQQAFTKQPSGGLASAGSPPLSSSPLDSQPSSVQGAWISSGNEFIQAASPPSQFSPFPITPSNTPVTDASPYIRQVSGSIGAEPARHSITHDDLALFLMQRTGGNVSAGQKFRALSPPASLTRYTHTSPLSAPLGPSLFITPAPAPESGAEPDIMPELPAAKQFDASFAGTHLAVNPDETDEDLPHGLAKASSFIATSPASSVGSLGDASSPRRSPRVVLAASANGRSPSRSLRAFALYKPQGMR